MISILQAMKDPKKLSPGRYRVATRLNRNQYRALWLYCQHHELNIYQGLAQLLQDIDDSQ